MAAESLGTKLRSQPCQWGHSKSFTSVAALAGGTNVKRRTLCVGGAASECRRRTCFAGHGLRSLRGSIPAIGRLLLALQQPPDGGGSGGRPALRRLRNARRSATGASGRRRTGPLLPGVPPILRSLGSRRPTARAARPATRLAAFVAAPCRASRRSATSTGHSSAAASSSHPVSATDALPGGRPVGSNAAAARMAPRPPPRRDSRSSASGSGAPGRYSGE